MKIEQLLKIETEEDKQRIYQLFEQSNSISDILKLYGVWSNSSNFSYIKQIAEQVGFDINIYKERRLKPKSYCLQCGKELSGCQKKFCSPSCASTYNNSLRGHMSEESKQKMRETFKAKRINSDNSLPFKTIEEKSNTKNITKRTCDFCGREFTDFTHHKYCSKECSDNYKKSILDKKNKKDTKLQGDLSEMEVAIFFMKRGFLTYKPIGDRCRDDLLIFIDELNLYLKVQVKSPYIKDGGLIVNCKSVSRVQGKYVIHIYNEEEIDLIAIPYNGECYIIPAYEIKGPYIKLRIDDLINSNSNVNFIEDYKFDNKISDIIAYKMEKNEK